MAYTLSGLAEVPGAAFSPGADTLYAVVARLDSATDSLLWSADMFETATGQLLASLPFPDAVELVDVVLDPELDRVYVPYRTEQRTVNGEDTGCFMAVLDKALSSRIAAVPAREILFSNGRGGAAQFDRTTKELHVMHFGTGNEAIKIHTYDTR